MSGILRASLSRQGFKKGIIAILKIAMMQAITTQVAISPDGEHKNLLRASARAVNGGILLPID